MQMNGLCCMAGHSLHAAWCCMKVIHGECICVSGQLTQASLGFLALFLRQPQLAPQDLAGLGVFQLPAELVEHI